MPRFTAPDGVSLSFTDEGDGLPLLCLAGLTRNGRDFDYVAPHLDGVRLIRPDYRGRGRSDHAPCTTYTVETEARDAVALLDHLDLPQAAILGSSRGGLIAMWLATWAKDRLLGVALNDIGPDVAEEGVAVIIGFLGRKPPFATLEEAAQARAKAMTGFPGVPMARWRDEAAKLFVAGPDGLDLPYDPKLREAFIDCGAQPVDDMWPCFDALAGLPLCTIRGANSDLLSRDTFAEMQRRRPDMIAADVPDRGHIPFLDEPEAVQALQRWLGMLRATG